jgi:hypothetical protein
MLTQNQREHLIQKIAQVRQEAASSAMEEIYQNPFWKEKYGERGAKQGNKDMDYNFNYLEAAIRMDTSSALEQYYRWLRGVLVYRGMCTLHLVETLKCIGRHLSRLLPEDWPAIEPYHQSSYRGLSYHNSTANALNAHAVPIAEATTRRMFHLGPAEQARQKERAYQACLRDNLYHIAYLADAFEMEKLKIFTVYIGWVTGFVVPFGVTQDSLFQDLKILQKETSAVLPQEHAAPVVRLLDVALSDSKHE